MRIVKPQFSAHFNRNHRFYPPGFVPVKDGELVTGILPAATGNCQWVTLLIGYSVSQTLWVSVEENTWQAVQKDWLYNARKRKHQATIPNEIGVSLRTWEGWEQGRFLPYHQAVRIALILWENGRW